MYKSSIGLIVSNLLMIWIISLNNVGPGWEVPVDVILLISRIVFVLFFSLLFSIFTCIIGMKKIKDYSFLFRVLYIITGLITCSFLIFLFVTEGFNGQFWPHEFPSFLFLIISISVVVLLFAALSISRFLKRSIWDLFCKNTQ